MYVRDWVQRTFSKSPEELFKEFDQLRFIDRNHKHMLYRGRPIARSKLFLVDQLQPSVPVYLFPGFQYAQIAHDYHSMHEVPLIDQMSLELAKQFGLSTNHVILTRYQDQHDNIGYHNDKPKTIDPDVPIFIISLGAQRPLLFRKNGTQEPCCEIPMEPGSLFVLGHKTNAAYQHSIAPSNEELGPRISIIFRQIIHRIPWAQVEKHIQKRHREPSLLIEEGEHSIKKTMQLEPPANREITSHQDDHEQDSVERTFENSISGTAEQHTLNPTCTIADAIQNASRKSAHISANTEKKRATSRSSKRHCEETTQNPLDASMKRQRYGGYSHQIR
jgi:hypothetical protein